MLSKRKRIIVLLILIGKTEQLLRSQQQLIVCNDMKLVVCGIQNAKGTHLIFSPIVRASINQHTLWFYSLRSIHTFHKFYRIGLKFNSVKII